MSRTDSDYALTATNAEHPFSETLLLFELAGRTFGIPAKLVLRALPYREPMALPKGHPGIHGVLQDRGTVIALLRDPIEDGNRDSSPEASNAAPTRTLVCATSLGHIGIPAEAAREVITIGFAHPPVPGSVIDSEAGPLTYIEPEALARRLFDDEHASLASDASR